MNVFLVDFKKDIWFYSKIIEAETQDLAERKAHQHLKPKYKIDEILDLGTKPTPKMS